MLSTLLDHVDRTYADRPTFFQLRARAMLVLYACGAVAASAAFFNDLLQQTHSFSFHVLVDGGLILTLLLGMALVVRGRDEWGTWTVPAALVLFSSATLASALEGRADIFYSGWARWYPVFIAVNGMLLAERSAILVTGFSVAWTGAFYPLFAHQLVGTPHELVPGDAVDMMSIELLTGVITITTIRLIEAELGRNRALNAHLEATVTERTDQLQGALRERAMVMEHMGDGLLVLDVEGEVRMVNDQFRGIMDVTSDEVTRVALPVSAIRLIDRVRNGAEGGFDHLELEDGRVVKILASPLPGDGPPFNVVVLAHDVTHEREVDRLKTEFITTVSHELRTPLTSVLGFTKMIRSRLEQRVAPTLTEPVAKKAMGQALDNLDIVASEGERLTALINDVLDIAKMEAGHVEWKRDPIDVAALVARSAAAVAALFPVGGPVALRVDLEADLPTLVGDEHRLVQVLVNLLSNASKFTREGEVVVTARRVDGGVRIGVADTGTGIANEQLSYVFERFRQVDDTLTDKPQGTGLGLPICQQIASAHGATIEVTSELMKGSEFFFVLPLSGA